MREHIGQEVTVRQTGAWIHPRSGARRAAAGLSVGAAALVLAACGSSGSVRAGGSGSGSSAAKTAATSAGGSPSGGSSGMITISAAAVPVFGTVLVDGSGRTLYILTSEKGGKITCTDASGCTRYWPDTGLPSGQTAAHAGSGIRPSLLGTVKDASGSLYVTYGGWPLYTYVGDKSAGQAAGEGITSFGGTWYVLGVDGNPVTAGSGSAGGSGGGASTTAPATSGGYNY